MEEPMKNILIIDDEKDLCFFVKANLELSGDYKVAFETDGEKGIKSAQRNKPDLILLDIVMPKFDGFEVLKRLKEDPHTITIPVIMLSALGDDDSKIKASGLYNEDYIVKPVEIDVLKSKINSILSR
jgi:DNA-binding response OmpR family regulator